MYPTFTPSQPSAGKLLPPPQANVRPFVPHLSYTMASDSLQTTKASFPRIAGPHFAGRDPGSEKKYSLLEKIMLRIDSIIHWLFSFFFQNPGWKAMKALKNSQEKIKPIINARRETRVQTDNLKRPSTGIAKASKVLDKDSDLILKFKEKKFFGMSTNYNVTWSPLKVVRDTLQNFYDGQGQTLDGVKIDIQSQANKQTQIHIAASATYDAHRLTSQGDTNKKDIPITAGGFGEGAKVLALLLLRDYGADTVRYRSNNGNQGHWEVEFSLADSVSGRKLINSSNKALMIKATLHNQPLPKGVGNDFTVSTKNATLIEEFKKAQQAKGRNLFFDANDEKFKDPTYENEVGGFKCTDPAEASHFFYTGQYREIKTGRYSKNPLSSGINIWTHTKCLSDDQRDRGEMEPFQMQLALKEIIDKMSLDDAVKALEMLKPLWFHLQQNKCEERDKLLFELICTRINSIRENKKLDHELAEIAKPESEKTEFTWKPVPGLEKFVALSASALNERSIKTIQEKGYIPVDEKLTCLGIQSSDTVLGTKTSSSSGQFILPTEKVQKKLDILTQFLKEVQNEDSFLNQLLPEDIKKEKSYYAQLFSNPPVVVENNDKYAAGISVDYKENRFCINKKLLEMPFLQILPTLIHETCFRHRVPDSSIINKVILQNLKYFETLKAQWPQ